MPAPDIVYPASTGPTVRATRAFLTAKGWTGVTVQPKLPTTMTARMVTVRDDGGTGRDGVSRRRHGFNIWANDPVTAQNLAIAVATGCRGALRATEVTDPIDVTDDTDERTLVAGKPLTHYFVSAVLVVRATHT